VNFNCPILCLGDSSQFVQLPTTNIQNAARLREPVGDLFRDTVYVPIIQPQRNGDS